MPETGPVSVPRPAERVLSAHRSVEETVPKTVLLTPRTVRRLETPFSCLLRIGMFDEWAFQTWGHVLVGACILSSLFLGLMLMVEEVVGDGARLSRAAITISLAAFVGYLGTAWIIRREMPTGR